VTNLSYYFTSFTGTKLWEKRH